MRTWQVTTWRVDGSHVIDYEGYDEDETRVYWKQMCRAALAGETVVLTEYGDASSVELERYEKESDR